MSIFQFLSMNHEARRPLRGDARAALDTIESVLLANGFRLSASTDATLEFEGRGLQSTRESPVRGATRIVVQARGGQLRLRARLGGVRFMALFFWLFPVVLWGGFAVAPLLGAGPEGERALNTDALKGMAIWIVLAPALTSWLRFRTARALDDLLESASVKSGAPHGGVRSA